MIHISEDRSAALASHEMAYDAIRAALIAAIGSDATSFPVVIGHAADRQNRFTIKSASNAQLLGVKVGSYFPTNDAVGLPRHGSVILLFDQARGRVGAVVESGRLNAFRTAAADAIATDALARKDAEVLAVFGTGNQAAYETAAIARIRPLTRILVVGRDAARTQSFIARLLSLGVSAEAADPEAACKAADIIVTATNATAPLFSADWVRPGTHVSSMGSDAAGKQELPPALLSLAHLFCDLPDQARRIGECQHAPAEASLTAIGAVLTGEAEGRRSAADITVFDSSGISLQDLYIAAAILRADGTPWPPSA